MMIRGVASLTPRSLETGNARPWTCRVIYDILTITPLPSLWGEPMSRSGHHLRRGLSRRQRVILALLATGLTSSEVAGVLRIPVVEVRTDISTAIDILGARSKLEAVLIALGAGLIELPPGPRLVRAQRGQPGGVVDGPLSAGADGLADSGTSASA